MVIAVGFSYFDDVDTVFRALDSFKNEVDYVFAIYGKYSDYDGSNDKFTHTLQKVVKDPKVKSYMYQGDEHDKRNVYLGECERFGVDTLIIVDADEWIEGDWTEFRKNLHEMYEKHPEQNIFGIKATINRAGDYSYYPRIWRNPSRFRYYHSHCVVKEDKRIYHLRASEAQKYLIDGLMIWHNDDLRDKDHLDRLYSYQQKLMDNEREIREKYK